MSDYMNLNTTGVCGLAISKGKSAIQIARKYGGRRRNFTGENFWARSYFVPTVLDEAMMRSYVWNRKRRISATTR